MPESAESGRWRVSCPECDLSGGEESKDTAEALARWHNEDTHGAADVAGVEETDR